MSVFGGIRNLLMGRPQAVQFEVGPVFREMILGLTPEELWRTQPQLRIVTSFLARNVAHLGLHVFERVSDTERRRITDSPLAKLLRTPNKQQTGYDLLETLVLDLALYDKAYWLVAGSNDTPSGWIIRPLPPAWAVNTLNGTFWDQGDVVFQNPDGTQNLVPRENLIVFHGYNPGQPKKGTSPVLTLKEILAEQVQAWGFRQQVWQRGGRVGTVLSRPAGVPWSDEARKRFAEEWKAKWTGNRGAEAGGTPILEDGMTLNRVGFSAREDEWAEVSRLALSTVASVYHVQPVMVGVTDSATFSSVREFRKALYTETLGPLLAMIEDRLNAFLVPMVSGDPDLYVEFNIREKLQGDFAEEAAVMSQAIGAPWMTRNEGRAIQNLGPVDGGDELVTPLNVLIGGQANPHDSGTQNQNSGRPGVKSVSVKIKANDVLDHERWADKSAEVLSGFFKRQRRVVLSALGSKDDSGWWDAKRWDRELAEDLLKLGMTMTGQIGRAQASDLGFAGEYDEDRTLEFVRAVAKSRAGAVNSTTKARLDAVLDDPDLDAAGVFDEAEQTRSVSGGAAFAAFAASFAVTEVARQLSESHNTSATKTWVVNSSNPRPEHASMDGETVGIDDVYSNGAKWPGDSVLGAEGVANCSCTSEVEINF